MKGFQGLVLLLLMQTFTAWTGAASVKSASNSASNEDDDNPAILKASSLSCSRDLMEVGVRLTDLQSSHLNASSGHLTVPTCTSHRQSGDFVFYQVSRLTGLCGNLLSTNATHAVYFNSLFLYPQKTDSFARAVIIPFSCAYPITTNASTNAINLLRNEGGLFGEGPRTTAFISLFHDSSFTKKYDVGPISLEVGSPLYVALTVDETDPSFRLVLDSCYTSGSSNPDNTPRSYLINSKCSANRQHVSVIENGVSLKDRFSALIFPVEGDNLSVYLHCTLSLCDRRNNNCVPNCSGRDKRSLRKAAELIQLGPLTAGPISWKN